MRRFLNASCALSALLAALPCSATVRSFAYTYESPVLAPGESELAPWSTFRVGRSRYYSALDGRLGLEHGVARGLQLGLYSSFSTQTEDVVADSLSRELLRDTRSEFSGAGAELKYQVSDAGADALGSALFIAAQLGPRQSELEARFVVDRAVGNWLFAGNVALVLGLQPVRNVDGAELQKSLVVQPSAAAAYVLPHNTSLGFELRAPLGAAGEAKSRTLFGGPVLRWTDKSMWATLGVEPQLLAFSGKSDGSRLALREHERLEVRLLAGFLL